MYVPPLTSEHRRIFKKVLFLFDHEEFKMKFYDIYSNILQVTGYEDTYIISCEAFYMLSKHGYFIRRKVGKGYRYRCRE